MIAAWLWYSKVDKAILQDLVVNSLPLEIAGTKIVVLKVFFSTSAGVGSSMSNFSKSFCLYWSKHLKLSPIPQLHLMPVLQIDSRPISFQSLASAACKPFPPIINDYLLFLKFVKFFTWGKCIYKLCKNNINKINENMILLVRNKLRP